MADTSTPVLVYNRIDVNRRKTRLLIAAFAALLLPFAYGFAQLLSVAHGLEQVLTSLDLDKPLVFPDLTGTEVVPLTTIALVAFICMVGLACLGDALISSLLLWRAGARRAHRDRELDLFRTVENLCIGAGLPPPTLYIVESTEPNAFTTGSNPEHTSLAISRGLLHLLDHRELAAVVAHELSHIGNHDTEFNTMLALLVATVRLPLRVVIGVARLISLLTHGEDQGPAGDEATTTLIAAGLVVSLVVMDAGLANVFAVEWNLRAIVAVALPIYVLVLAPGCATLLRRTMSQERDFLADADAALLTRDPEGVALALAKVSGAIHFIPNADTATAPLYFVDPLPRASWWDAYPSHPPIEARIAVLARMGGGIPEAELRDALATGEEFQERPPDVEPAPQPTSRQIAGREAALCEPGTQARLTDSRTLLFKSEDHSTVLADLDSNVAVTILDLKPQCLHVRLVDGTVGYIRLFAGLTPLDDDLDGDGDASAKAIDGIHYRPASPVVAEKHTVSDTPFRVPGTQFRLTDQSTPLYAKPDGWSDVMQQISPGTVVTLQELVGSFARVATDRTVGYISSGAGVAGISPK